MEEIRREIDAIDDSIVDLLNRRASLARKIAIVKMMAGLPIGDPGREQSVISRVAASTNEPQDVDSIERIFHSILRESRLIQAKTQFEFSGDGVHS